jgi:AraC family transcriptional regulator, L-rhamnose operon regulatory protein RhaS
MMQVPMNWFTSDETFPFFIQLGGHTEDLYQHSHTDFSELVIVLGGTAVHTVEGEEYMLRKRDVFVINMDTRHGFTNPHELRICNIMFGRNLFPFKDADIRKTAGFHALFMIAPSLSKDRHFQSCLRLSDEAFETVVLWLEKMIKEYEQKPAGYQTYLKGAFISLVVFLSRCYESQAELQDTKGMRIALPLAYIENHFARDISLRYLSGLANLSPRHFFRIFQETYRTTPKAYVAQLRIARARMLLLQSKKSITEIALDCGYSDSNYFARVFKKNCGMTPLQFRSAPNPPERLSDLSHDFLTDLKLPDRE